MADRCGRRKTLAICCFIFIIAALWMAGSTTLLLLVLGRFIVGCAVGVAAQCVPIYLSEISPSSIRGFILTLNSLAITGGQLLSYIVAYFLANVNHSWRYLFGISSIPAIIFILLLDFIPESPRWLISKGEFSEAHKSLTMIYPTASHYQVNLKLRKLIIDLGKLRHYQDIEEPLLIRSRSFLRSLNSSLLSQNREQSTAAGGPIQPQPFTSIAGLASIADLTAPIPIPPRTSKKHVHKMEARTKRALIIGCVLMFFQQITGFNAFMYYAAVIFSKLNLENPLLPAILVALTNFLFTFVALRYVDKIGKRLMLLYTLVVMSIGLLLVSIGFDKNNMILILISIVIFVGGYASALGTVPWTCVEFLPLNRRAFGSSCISCTNWLTNAIVALSYLSLMDSIGNGNTMLIFAGFTSLAWLFVYFFYPEVKGLSLEEIGKVFEHGIDVHTVYRNYY